MKEQRGPIKSSYPTYTTKEPCMLMRITAFNYEKVVEVSGKLVRKKIDTMHVGPICVSL